MSHKIPYSSAEERRKTSSVTSIRPARVRKTDGYRLMSRRPPDRNWLGELGTQTWKHFGSFTEATRQAGRKTQQPTLYRLSSAAERQAHNLEVVGSKPTGGILHFGSFTEATRQVGRKTQQPTLWRERSSPRLMTLKTCNQNTSTLRQLYRSEPSSWT